MLENWLSESHTCVKLGESWSSIFRISSVESDKICLHGLQSFFQYTLMTLASYRITSLVPLLYDDILLLAPSVIALQKLLRVCEQKVDSVDTSTNVIKTCCMRSGARQLKIIIARE